MGNAAYPHAFLSGKVKKHDEPLVAPIGDTNLRDLSGSQRFENRVDTVNQHSGDASSSTLAQSRRESG
jgi:hypothetical protein